jgi:protein-S-isoprenylcysteine O-methyltransferase Ste14
LIYTAHTRTTQNYTHAIKSWHEERIKETIDIPQQEKIFDHERISNRDDLAGEHKIGDLGQLILLLIFLGVWITDTFFLKFSVVLTNPLSLIIRILLGIVILVIASWFEKSGLNIAFDEVREVPRIIHEGIFSIVRHPIYMGSILVYLGFLVFSISVTAAIIWVVIIGFYYYLCRHEEKNSPKNLGTTTKPTREKSRCCSLGF